MTIRGILSLVFLGLSVFFFVVTAIGLFRFRSVYARLHVAGKCLTGGALSAIFAYLSVAPTVGVAARLTIAAVLLLFTNALGTHAIARGAHHSGIAIDTLDEDSMEGTVFAPRPAAKDAAAKDAAGAADALHEEAAQ